MTSGIFGKLTDFFSRTEEKIEPDWNEASEEFSERKSRELERTRQKSRELVNETQTHVEKLDSDLEELKDYSDAEDLNIVEDVAENFYRTRKNLVEKFDPSEKIEQHYRYLDDFLVEFNDVSRKEGAVMKRVEKKSGNLPSRLEKLMNHRDKIGDFLEEDYSIVKKLHEIQRFEEKIREKREKIEEISEKIEQVQDSDIEDKLEKADRKVEELHESDAWQEKESLEQELEILEDKKSQEEKKISRKVSKLERGLKKMVYSVENEGEDFKGDLKKLKQLMDGNYQHIENPQPDLEKAAELLDELDKLDDRQMEKFEETVDDMDDFESVMDEVEDYRENISKIESRLDEIQLEKREDRLEKKRSKLREQLEEQQEKIKSLKEKQEELEWEIEEEKKNLEAKMNEYLKPEVSIEKNPGSQKSSDGE